MEYCLGPSPPCESDPDGSKSLECRNQRGRPKSPFQDTLNRKLRSALCCLPFYGRKTASEGVFGGIPGCVPYSLSTGGQWGFQHTGVRCTSAQVQGTGVTRSFYRETRRRPSWTGARSTQQFGESSLTKVSLSNRMRRLPA